MADYKEIKGLYIQTVSSDPSNLTIGDVWYNSATFQLKAYVGVAAWSASSGLGTARYGMGSFGIQTAKDKKGAAAKQTPQISKADMEKLIEKAANTAPAQTIRIEQAPLKIVGVSDTKETFKM